MSGFHGICSRKQPLTRQLVFPQTCSFLNGLLSCKLFDDVSMNVSWNTDKNRKQAMMMKCKVGYLLVKKNPKRRCELERWLKIVLEAVGLFRRLSSLILILSILDWLISQITEEGQEEWRITEEIKSKDYTLTSPGRQEVVCSDERRRRSKRPQRTNLTDCDIPSTYRISASSQVAMMMRWLFECRQASLAEEGL